MEQNQKVSIQAGIEPKALKLEATPRLDPRDIDTTEDAVYESSELIALVDTIKQNTIPPLLVDDFDKFLEEEATAAGLGTGSGGDGSTFVQLLRIVENVDPLAYEYSYERQDVPDVEYDGGVNYANQIETETPVEPEPEVPEDEEDPKEDPRDPPKKDEPDIPPKEDEKEEDDFDVETPEKEHQDNGWGNGDDDPPGNSGPNNNAENSDADNPLEKERPKNGTDHRPDSGDSDTGGGDDNPAGGANPGNDKPVGNSPWDGETGASGKPGTGNLQDGVDTDPNQPGGKDKGQNLEYNDILSNYDSASYDHYPKIKDTGIDMLMFEKHKLGLDI